MLSTKGTLVEYYITDITHPHPGSEVVHEHRAVIAADCQQVCLLGVVVQAHDACRDQAQGSSKIINKEKKKLKEHVCCRSDLHLMRVP